MKLTKSQLNQIVQEELKSLMEVDADIAAALMGKAGLPQSAQDTKMDRPIVPQDLGDEDEPASERAEEDEVIESAREMYMQGALMLPDEYHEKYKSEKLHQQVFTKEFLPKFIEKPHMDPYHARAIIISGLEDISGTMDDVFIDLESNPLEENKMKLTKTKLQQIIKEELELHTIIQDVAKWMNDNGVYVPEDAIGKWWDGEGKFEYPGKEEEIKNILLQHTGEIEDVM
jgi:hypothetical protein